MRSIPNAAFVFAARSGRRDDARTSKRIKILPHRFLPHHDVSVWIDGSLEFRRDVDLDALVARFFASGKPLQVRAHPYRRCIYEEAVRVHELGKDTRASTGKVVDMLRRSRFPANYGLTENNFLVRLHRDARLIRFSERWWQLVESFSHRDQLSFMYALWHEELPVDVIDDRVDPALEHQSGGRIRGPFLDGAFNFHPAPPKRSQRPSASMRLRSVLSWYEEELLRRLFLRDGRRLHAVQSLCRYRARFGRFPNVVRPRRLSEALARDALFGDRRIQLAQIADPVQAKAFVAGRAGTEFVAETCGLVDPDDADEATVRYAVWCFSGVPVVVRADSGTAASHRRSFHSADARWHRLPFVVAYPGHAYDVSRPAGLARMLDVAKAVSRGFRFLQVAFVVEQHRPRVLGLTALPDFARIGPSPSDADVLMHRVYRDPSVDVVELFEAMQLGAVNRP